MTTITLGDTTIIRVEETCGPMFEADVFLPDFDRAAIEPHLDWLVPDHYVPETNLLVASIHSWVIRTKSHTILVDTCAGNHKERPNSPRFHQQNHPYMRNLAAVGVHPDEIDFVCCSHLHADHVGWNTQLIDGRWVPTFKNAKYLFSKKEHDRWCPQPDENGVLQDVSGGVYNDSVLPVVEAGMAELIEWDHQVNEQLYITPTPGHTPGHVSLNLRAAGRKGLFIGDVMHSPLQLPFPDWNSAFCEDPEQARATRRQLLEYCCENNVMVLPQHFGTPYYGTVERAGDAFKFKFADRAVT